MSNHSRRRLALLPLAWKAALHGATSSTRAFGLASPSHATTLPSYFPLRSELLNTEPLEHLPCSRHHEYTLKAPTSDTSALRLPSSARRAFFVHPSIPSLLWGYCLARPFLPVSAVLWAESRRETSHPQTALRCFLSTCLPRSGCFSRYFSLGARALAGRLFTYIFTVLLLPAGPARL